MLMTQQVNALQFTGHRIVTGCAIMMLRCRRLTQCSGGDGKIRVWNMAIGACLRVFRGNSRCDPITQIRVRVMCTCQSTMVHVVQFIDSKAMCVNTTKSLQVLVFDELLS